VFTVELPVDVEPFKDTPTMQETLDIPSTSSAYARPPTISRMTGEAALSSPPDYTEPSAHPSTYPRYLSHSSFSSPSVSTSNSDGLPSPVGPSANFPSQNEASHAPPSFSRPPPPNLYYTPFPPTYLIANSNHLDGGFPVVPPPSIVEPHPFSSHDVREGDWIR